MIDIYKNIIIIPALNPSVNLVEYVDNLIYNGFEHIILIDDGSNSEAKTIFETIGNREEVTILEHVINLGKGRALKDAFNYALSIYENDTRIKGVITVDSDGQHTVEDVIKISKELIGQEIPQLILGTRDFNGKDIPIKSKYGNKITSNVFQFFFGKKVNDTQTGLRGVSKEYVKTYLDLYGERFEYEMNMLIFAVNCNQNIIEIPIDTVYVDNNSETHFRPIIDSLKIYRIILKNFFYYILSSLSASIIDLAIFQIFIIMLNGWQSVYQLAISTVIARIISSIYNFAVNKRAVFKSKNDSIVQLVKYYTLCIVQMAISAGCVVVLDYIFKGNKLIEKIITDTVLFFLSYRIQRSWVFRRK